MSYLDLLNMRCKIPYKLFIFVLLFLITFIFLIQKEICDVYNTYGYINNGNVILDIPIDYLDTFDTLEYLRINNKIYNFEVVNISEILVDENNLINYQEITIKVINSDFIENMIYKVTFNYNKEKVYLKLKKLIV